MSQNRQIPRLQDLAFDAMVKQGLFRTKFTMIAQSCIPIPLATQQERMSGIVMDMAKQRLLSPLWHAVIHDDRQTVSAMLDLNPELLLLTPNENCVIESQYTWQKFYAEDALTMAVKLKQVEMTELLLSYYDKLEQTYDVIDAKNNALSAWKSYEIVSNEIIIPKEYEDFAQSLINVFREETFPHGVPGKNNVPWNIVLSQQTELALTSLLNILIPKKAVKLDEHVDVELLLLAVYKSYKKNMQCLIINLASWMHFVSA